MEAAAKRAAAKGAAVAGAAAMGAAAKRAAARGAAVAGTAAKGAATSSQYRVIHDSYFPQNSPVSRSIASWGTVPRNFSKKNFSFHVNVPG